MDTTYPSSVIRFEKEFHKPKQGRTLIVGSFVVEGKEDRRNLYSDVLGVDMRKGPGVDLVLDMEEALPEDLGKFDNVECQSVLEHSRAPWKLAANIEDVMNLGATIYVAVPFVWRVHSYPDDYWRFTISGVKELFPRIEWSELLYAHEKLSKKTTSIRENFIGHVFLARTEVLGVGVRI